MRALSFTRLRYRLLLLVLVAVVPGLVLTLYTAFAQRHLAAEGAKQDALRVARVAAATHERLLEGARSLLVGLAQLPEGQMQGDRACRAHFTEVLEQLSPYANLGAIRPDGHVFCQVRPLRGSLAPGEGEALVRRAGTRGFTASGYRAGADHGPASLRLYRAAVDRTGVVWALVFVELDLGWVSALGERVGLPPGGALTVLDSAGTVLAHHPEDERRGGRALGAARLLAGLREGPAEGTREGVGPDGQPELHAFTRLADTGGPGTVYATVSVPRALAFAEARWLLTLNLAWTGVGVILALGAAALVSDVFILRPVNAVVAAARRLTAGDLGARASVRSADEIGVMAATFNIMAARLSERVREEQDARRELARRVSELDLLNRLGELLLACRTLEEAHEVIGKLLARAFDTERGAVFVVSSSRDVVEAVARWGPQEGTRTDGFGLDRCWALRGGHPHLVADGRTGVLCQHLSGPPPRAYLCAPLVAQGDTLGVLHVARPAGPQARGEEPFEAAARLAEAIAGPVALGLANLRLGEALRAQSVCDALTGLYNRRHLEDTLCRELRRASRQARALAVLLLNVDHFKRINDSFGHDVGDAGLRALAACLRDHLRREDTAGRPGGDEFVVLLPETSLADACARAEQLRAAVKTCEVRDGQRAIGPLTVSIGVAAFPDHGLDAAHLLAAADAALYTAKRRGRDRVETPAGPPRGA